MCEATSTRRIKIQVIITKYTPGHGDITKRRYCMNFQTMPSV